MSLKETTDTVQCYIGNAEELLNDLEGEVFTEEGNVVVFNVEKGGKLAQILWNQLRETILECKGKSVVVKYPGNTLGLVLRLALGQILKFDLEAPVVIDSPELIPDHIKQQIIAEAKAKGQI